LNNSDWESYLIRFGMVVVIAIISGFYRPFHLSLSYSISFGIILAIAANLVELRLQRVRIQTLAVSSLGALLGGVLGLLFVPLLGITAHDGAGTAQFWRILIPLTGAFAGLLLGISKSHYLDLSSIPGFAKHNSVNPAGLKLLDTSVLIDGRIADIVESGFLAGPFVLPEFILHELQAIADSPDSMKRNRGRRGLDIVQRLQQLPGVSVELSTQDYPGIREVDAKLIELAKGRGAQIVTNDFNLNKVSQVQGLTVLNINQLANALRPVVLPGETMRVFILKEGKEYGQGIAYLDDGTMVVVDNARRHLSKTIDVTVTSVLQTTAGKMIFGKYDERHAAEARSASASASGSNG
jgi:uncharacterized protein YacL